MSNYRLINEYEPPRPEDLQRLKDDLGFTGVKMADLAGVAGGNIWRRYTGGANPRTMSAQTLFYMAAQLALSPEELDRVVSKMVEIGARIK
ncbi:XRE family transcriptional regulator [Enterobacter huaxiensis]|uniref:XRE family transcriptional regulator n=1 Tax=Enterobacter huaxiensis TaxID=2494702 RepID=UPI0021758488|nr:XRE family transcriptional regulator [Enterobacter huaxiensis]MCS5452549.1 XRE family transcriptional regulator [Enterobacter huaxiensis]